MTIGLGHYLTVAAILFTLGIFGIFINRKNVIVILMSIELILLAVNLNFVAFSAALNDLAGQVMAMFVLTVAAAEAAIGLAIVVIYFRNRGSIQVEDVNLMKGGIILADQVTTVSPTYAREIQTGEHGAGLDGILRSLSFKLHGILNGIDVDEWDPATDLHIRSHFDKGHRAGKSLCKRALLRELNLKHKARTPLLGFVSRLADQKGIDLLIAALPHMIAAGAHAVILGSGEPRYENALQQIAAEHPESCRVVIGFDSALAHRIYAGADVLLMPSIYEPCGLNQMYALRYGTVPVVRLTGGLADTVIPFDGANLDAANGFGFFSTNAADFYTATWLAMLNYRESKSWRRLQANGMAADFSWERSARQYEAVYDRALHS